MNDAPPAAKKRPKTKRPELVAPTSLEEAGRMLLVVMERCRKLEKRARKAEREIEHLYNFDSYLEQWCGELAEFCDAFEASLAEAGAEVTDRLDASFASLREYVEKRRLSGNVASDDRKAPPEDDGRRPDFDPFADDDE